MDLGSWREKQKSGEWFTTPSGLEVRVKRVSLMDLAVTGTVPTPIVAMANKVLEKGLEEVNINNMAEYAQVINAVVKAAVTEPQIGDTSNADTLGVEELTMLDRLAIFRYVNNVAESLRPFRRKQNADAESA
jgi:hypothetical protein